MISGFPWLNLGIHFEKLWGALPLIGITGTSFVIIMIFCLIFEKKILFEIWAFAWFAYSIAIWPWTLSKH